jgi:hypothetical protein
VRQRSVTKREDVVEVTNARAGRTHDLFSFHRENGAIKVGYHHKNSQGLGIKKIEMRDL